MFQIPVVLIIYNRPSFAEQVFSMIRKIKPKRLFIIADGGKNAEDQELCRQARAKVENIDWETTLSKKYGDVNSGCTTTVIDGLDWVFDQVEKAIILEDDCVPDLSFFRYCEELLLRYENDEQVMHISGCNLLQKLPAETSYVFSHHLLPPWGWATWRRAWKKYNHSLDSWQLHKKEIHRFISQDNFKIWTDTFELIRQHKITWDITWNVDIWANGGTGIVPSVNLVKNIGFTENATFTKQKESNYSSLTTDKMQFPLIHPENKKALYDHTFEREFIALIKEINAAFEEKS